MWTDRLSWIFKIFCQKFSFQFYLIVDFWDFWPKIFILEMTGIYRHHSPPYLDIIFSLLWREDTAKEGGKAGRWVSLEMKYTPGGNQNSNCINSLLDLIWLERGVSGILFSFKLMRQRSLPQIFSPGNFRIWGRQLNLHKNAVWVVTARRSDLIWLLNCWECALIGKFYLEEMYNLLVFIINRCRLRLFVYIFICLLLILNRYQRIFP